MPGYPGHVFTWVKWLWVQQQEGYLGERERILKVITAEQMGDLTVDHK